MNTQRRSTLNRALRSADHSRAATSNDNPREPTPGPSGKRPAPSDADKRDGKRLRLSPTAQSSNSEPGCSRQQAIIIQDDHPIESSQARVIVSNGDSSSSRSTDENLQELMPNAPIQSDGEALANIQRTQISGSPSITNDAQEPSIDDFYRPSSHNLLISSKISAHLYRDMNGGRRLAPIAPPVEKRIRFMNSTEGNTAVAAQNPSCLLDRAESLSIPSIEEQSVTQYGSQDRHGNMRSESGIAISSEENRQEAVIDVEEPHDVSAEELRSLVQGANSIASAEQNVPSFSQPSSVRRVDGQRDSPTRQPHNITPSRQNQRLPKIDQSFERHPLRESTDTNGYGHLPNSRSIKMRIRLTRKNPSIPTHQTRELPQPRKSQSNQRYFQPQPNRPEMHMNRFIKPKNNRVDVKNLGGILKSLANSVRQALREGAVVHQQLAETSPNESEVVESHSNVPHKMCQTGPKGPLRDVVPSDPSARVDLGTPSGRSTDDQMGSRHVSQQQIFDNLATNQMPSTSRASQDVILETAETYRNLSGAVERFDRERNSASSASLANVPVEVPVPEERLEVSAKQDSRNRNEQGSNVADNTQKKKQDNSRRSPVETINDGQYPGTASGSSTDDQTHSVLEQQMLDNFAALLNQMNSTLRATSGMSNDLQSSILEAAGTFKNLLGVVKRFNTVADEEGSTRFGSRIEVAENARQNKHNSGPSPVGASNPGIAPGSSTDDQAHSRHVLEQQMLDNFAILFTQMASTTRKVLKMANISRDSIFETGVTYRNLLGSVETYNTVRNSASSAAMANVPITVPLVTEETLEGSTTHGSRNGNEQGYNVAGNSTTQQRKLNNSWRLVLPPEYDTNHTRWTLKYPHNLPGLVEISSRSRVYVSYGHFMYCLEVSKDCKSLARRLLSEVFNRNALSVCLTLEERAQSSDNGDSNARPELDDHASTVLLNFVIERGLQRGWNTDLRPILNSLDSKIKGIRFKYGVMVQAN